MLPDELVAITSWDECREDAAATTFQRFAALVRESPSPRSYYYDLQERVAATLAAALPKRAGSLEEDPQVALAALSLAGVWRIQYDALQRHLLPGRSQADVRSAVNGELAQAVKIAHHGLAANPI